MPPLHDKITNCTDLHSRTIQRCMRSHAVPFFAPFCYQKVVVATLLFWGWREHTLCM